MRFSYIPLHFEQAGSLNINLGSGSVPMLPPHFINVDQHPFDCVDIVRDVEKYGLPFSNSTVDNVWSAHLIEHVEDWVFLFNEIWRVLKPGGLVDTSYPIGDSTSYKWSPPHKKAWYPDSFTYLTDNPWCADAHRAYGIKTNFFITLNDKDKDDGVGHVEMRALKRSYPGGFKPILTSNLPARIMTDLRAVRVDLGCGSNKQTIGGRYIGVDKYECQGVDVIKDAERGMPFADKSVDYIYASHFLEHIDDLIFVMEEIWRVLKKKGIVHIVSPLWTTQYAYAHPDHKRLIHPNLWDWWNPEGEGDRESYGAKAQFLTLENKEKGDGLFTTLMAVK